VPTPTDIDLQLAELRELEGSMPLAQFFKRYNLPKSTVYEDADSGVLETFTTARGTRMVSPAAGLAYLKGAGDRSGRIKGVAKTKQEAARAGGDAAC
jgi:hypothetical protein